MASVQWAGSAVQRVGAVQCEVCNAVCCALMCQQQCDECEVCNGVLCTGVWRQCDECEVCNGVCCALAGWQQCNECEVYNEVLCTGVLTAMR